MPRPSVRPVVYVEDDSDDSELLQRALYKIHSTVPLQVLADAASAWDFLSGGGATPNPPVPSLLLLDIQLRRSSGLDFLAKLKGHDVLKTVPVVMMTSSARVADVERAFALGASFYLVKAADFVGTIELAKALDAYWKALEADPEAVGTGLAMIRALSVQLSASPAPRRR